MATTPLIAALAGPGSEQRRAQRFSLVLRAARLIAAEGEFLCVLRDVSASGIKAKLFHPLPAAPRFALALGTGDTHDVEPVWERDGHAGFRFCEGDIDVEALIDEVGLHPKRQLRVNLSLPLQLTAGTLRHHARLTNLSQQGAGIESDAMLALGEPVRISAPGFPEHSAKVRWRHGTHYGLSLDLGFRLDELAQLTWRLQMANHRAS